MNPNDAVKALACNDGWPIISGELQWREPNPTEVYGDPDGLPWLYIGSAPHLMPEVDGIPTRRDGGEDAQYQRRMFDVMTTYPFACGCLDGHGCLDYTDMQPHTERRSYQPSDLSEWRRRNREPGARPVW